MAEADCSGEHFVEKYQADLIKRVSNIGPILDEFLHKEIIKQYSYDEIHSLPTSQKKMTALFSGPLQSSQGKAMFYKLLNKHEPYLIDELKRTDVATVAVKETLKDLSSEDLRKFKWWLQFPLLQLGLSQIPWVHLGKADTADQLVDVMVQNLGQQYVEVINEVLMDMNRTDLVQRLSETSSGLKEKHSVDEPWSALIQEQVETIESDIQRLLETLAGLSDGELQKFKDVLLSEMYFRCPSDYLLMTFEVPDKQNLVLFIVLSLVLIYGHMSVNKTMWILMEMNRIDLVHRLSRSSSGPKEKLSDEHRSTLIKKVATKSAVKLHLLETMKEFDYSEFGIFVEFLQWIVLQKNLPVISLMLRRTEDKAGTVDLMMQTYGYQSVDLTREVVYRMSSEFKASAPTLREPCVDEQQPALPEREAAMASVKKELLKTLKYLSNRELEKYKMLLLDTERKKGLPRISRRRLKTADRYEIVKLMMEIYDQQSVEVNKEVLMEMDKRDLVERSETRFRTEKRPSKPILISSFVRSDKFYRQVPGRRRPGGGASRQTGRLEAASMASNSPAGDGQRRPVKLGVVPLQPGKTQDDRSRGEWDYIKPDGFCVVAREAEDQGQSTEATMASVKKELLETLKDLSNWELEKYKMLLLDTERKKGLPRIPRKRLQTADRIGIVELMMEIYDQQSVEVNKEVLMKMGRRDLVERFSETHLGLTEKRPSKPIQKEATMASVKKELLETLKDLSDRELEEYKMLLLDTERTKGLPRISRKRLKTADRYEIVELMMEIYDQQSVEVLMEMGRKDLVERFSETHLGLTEKRPSKPIQKEATMASVKKELLETLTDLSDCELDEFKCVVQSTRMKKGLPRISSWRLETADRVGMVELMTEIYNQQSVEVTKEVLMEMDKRDLVQRFSDFSLGSRRPSRSLDHEDCGSIMQVSSDWTELEPEVNINDADKAPTYSHQSEAGTFECSVSGLRWICKGKVSFKYQFCPLEEHMERINSLQYMPAGPLMDITVTAGKLDEVHLPHWICIDDNPKILDKFAVLHIDDCGEVVEKVSEVTSSHVKLCEPVFSPRAVLMRVGFPVKINCNVLIYKTNTAFLTLHVYLIPRDPGLQEEMDKREMSYGYNVIRKPYPERSLKIHDRFILTADLEGAEINPKDLKLRYESRTPNFFEVYTKNPNEDFVLKLDQKKEQQQVWTCIIRKDEYQNTGHKQDTDVTGNYPKTTKKAITDMLANLSKKDLDRFCEELLDRREEPRVKRNMVEGESYLVVGNVLVETFTEARAPGVVVELLREIGCHEIANQLAEETGGQS